MRKCGCRSIEECAHNNVYPSPNYCQWFIDDHDGSYDSECGNKFQFVDGNPKENGFKFCPYCGGRIGKKPINMTTKQR